MTPGQTALMRIPDLAYSRAGCTAGDKCDFAFQLQLH
jgi:hypothetical protein